MPKVPLEKFDPSQPLPNIQGIELEKIRAIAKDKRSNERKTTILTIISIIVGIISLIFAYLTLIATEKANSANQTAADTTNKLIQVQETLRQQQEQLTAYQSKNDSMSATVAKMKIILKKHGIVFE